jgi:alkylation response protein AidB-like acyl-CoA dehydrogenase
MIYELRTYWAAPGKIEALHRRFRTLTLGIFKRHAMHVVGFWTPVPVTADSGDLVYMLRFADEEQMKAAWEAFRADAEWIAGKAATETDGTLVTKLTSIVLQATDYSPEI